MNGFVVCYGMAWRILRFSLWNGLNILNSADGRHCVYTIVDSTACVSMLACQTAAVLTSSSVCVYSCPVMASRPFYVQCISPTLNDPCNPCQSNQINGPIRMANCKTTISAAVPVSMRPPVSVVWAGMSCHDLPECLAKAACHVVQGADFGLCLFRIHPVQPLVVQQSLNCDSCGRVDMERRDWNNQ